MTTQNLPRRGKGWQTLVKMRLGRSFLGAGASCPGPSWGEIERPWGRYLEMPSGRRFFRLMGKGSLDRSSVIGDRSRIGGEDGSLILQHRDGAVVGEGRLFIEMLHLPRGLHRPVQPARCVGPPVLLA